MVHMTHLSLERVDEKNEETNIINLKLKIVKIVGNIREKTQSLESL